MHFPTHWVRESHQAHDRNGKPVTRTAYGWSTVSDAEASRVGRERARRAVEFAISGSTQRNEYGYGVDPAREELVDTLDVGGLPIAAITRNRYGALVLNTQRVLFADIDQRPTGGWIKRLFSKAPLAGDAMMETMRNWQATRPRHGLRVYQTAAGFRVLFVEAQHAATDEATTTILRSMNADPLYVALCRRQGCFRARLTPKPWRCDAGLPGITFPYVDDEHERAQRSWEVQYAQRTSDYATCRLIGTIGSDARDPVVTAIVSLHDKRTLNDGKPLA